MAQAKKKTSKKTAKKTAPVTATPSDTLPQSVDIPKGMKQMGGGYATSWKPENVGDSLHGEVSGVPHKVDFKQGRKTVQRNVMEVTDMDGNPFSVWQSATLGELFEAITDMGGDAIGQEVYLCFDGFSKKKPGQNPHKLFTVATAE